MEIKQDDIEQKPEEINTLHPCLAFTIEREKRRKVTTFGYGIDPYRTTCNFYMV